MKSLVIIIVFILQVCVVVAQHQIHNASLFSVPQGFHFAILGSAHNLSSNVQDTFALRHPEPLFVVNADNRTLIIMPAATSGLTFNHSLPSDLQALDPHMIREIRVYNSEDAIDRFGQPARNGAIVIELKAGSFEKLPAYLADRFSEKK